MNISFSYLCIIHVLLIKLQGVAISRVEGKPLYPLWVVGEGVNVIPFCSLSLSVSLSLSLSPSFLPSPLSHSLSFSLSFIPFLSPLSLLAYSDDDGLIWVHVVHYESWDEQLGTDTETDLLLDTPTSENPSTNLFVSKINLQHKIQYSHT